MKAIRDAAEQILLTCCADLRAVIEGLDPEALMWRPAPDTSPIAILIRHCATGTPTLLGAAVTGRIDRKRYVEEERIPAFSDRVSDAAELRELIDRLEADSRRLVSQIPDDGLGAAVESIPPVEGPPTSRAYMLLHAVDHLREHVGHAQLTRQIWESGR
jgi:hypothetical protein